MTFVSRVYYSIVDHLSQASYS